MRKKDFSRTNHIGLLGQENMLCEWEKSSRCLMCTEVVSLHAHTTHSRKCMLTGINRQLYKKTGASVCCMSMVVKHEVQLK